MNQTVPVAATADRVAAPGRFPPQIKFIIGNEACERFSYYGMLGILELYLKDRMQMGSDAATETLHLFGAAVYFLPLLGGWVADRFWGRYGTILGISLFYCLGHGTLALFEGSRPGLLVGLALLAIGAGGIKPCVAAFVGDQFGSSQGVALRKVYGWFYWSVNLGAAAGFFIIPLVHTHAGYRWAFGIPGIFMALATLIFWLGTKHYVRQPPQRAAKAAGFLQVTWFALAHRRGTPLAESPNPPGDPGIKRSSDSGGLSSFFRPALQRFSAEEVAGAQTIANILMIFVSVPMFWALFNQVNSTWVLQGNSMKPFYVLDGETMQSAGAVLVMIWVPILTLGVYPWLDRRGILPTPLRRMSAGMVLGGVAFILCGLIQARMDRGATLSIAWQLIPYIVLEAGEVMLSATALEFAFSQAPERMKSIIMSFWLMTIAAGHFLVAVFTNLNSRFVHAHGAMEFFFYAVLMLIVSGIFIFLASRYRSSAGR